MYPSAISLHDDTAHDIFERLVQLGQRLHTPIADQVDPERHLGLLVLLVLQDSLDALRTSGGVILRAASDGRARRHAPRRESVPRARQ
jgi:hypothetical protein